jgi:hypothetical protein
MDPTRSTTYLPFRIGAAYVAVTYALYRFGPVPWPGRSDGYVLALLLAYWLAVGVGFYLGTSTRLRSRARPRELHLDKVVYAAAVAAIVNFPLALLAELGELSPDIGFGLGRQAEVYSTRVDALGNQAPAVLLGRALLAPLLLGGLVLGIRYYGRLSRLGKIAVLVVVAAQVLTSFARGTDKELFDVFVVLVSVALLWRPRGRRAFVRLGAVMIVGLLVVGLFADRRAVRLGSERVFCVDRVSICVSPESDTSWAVLREDLLFLMSGMTVYLSQGYHGLSLAQDAEFPSTAGMGSSVAIRNLSTIVGSDAATTSYQAQLTARGWPETSAWSTVYTELANDLTFPGVAAAMLAFGYLWARSYRRAVRGDVAAMVVFVLCCTAIAYSPANNQLGISLPSLTAALFWFGAYAFSRPRGVTSSVLTETSQKLVRSSVGARW